MTTADDLRAAAEYIRGHGLARLTAEASDGSVCALGAIYKICYKHEVLTLDWTRFNHAARVLSDYLYTEGLFTHGSLPKWSDSSQAGDVIASLEKAAAWVEEQT